MLAGTHLRRVGLLVSGVLLGLVGMLLGLWLYFRSAQMEALRGDLAQELGLPAEVFEIEAVPPSGLVRVAVRDVALLDERGDTMLVAPRLRLRLGAVPLLPDEPIIVQDVEIVDPTLHLVREPDGEWNVFGALRATAGGEPVENPQEQGRPLFLRDVRIVHGRARILTEWLPEPGDSTVPETVTLTRFRGRTMQVRSLRELNAQLPLIRVGGADGWRVEIGDLEAQLLDPDVRVTQMRGVLEAEGEDGVRFAISTLRTPQSTLQGSGLVRFVEGEELPRLDVTMAPSVVAFSEMRWVVPTLPAEGQASLSLTAQTRPSGRIALDVRELNATGYDSEVRGSVRLLAGAGAAPALLSADLALAPLDLRILDAFGLGERLPYAGEVRGSLRGDADDADGPVQVDLLGSFRPRAQPEMEPSVVALQGGIGFRAGDDQANLEALTVSFRPLQLAALRPLLPEQEERLRGTLNGFVSVSGTPDDLRVGDGELSVDVGTVVPTRVAGINGRIRQDPRLRYELRMAAEPLALATLSALVPALPFRSAQLAGPIAVRGDPDSVHIGATLRGDAGAIDGQVDLALTDPLRFSLNAELEAFRAASVLSRDLPVEGPLTGTVGANGSIEDFRFEVDLDQAAGRFALQGQLRRPEGGAQLDVAGTVSDFQIGTLIGAPGLLESPVGGTIQIAGGGRQPYRFDLDLRSAEGVSPPALLDVEGTYTAGEVPVYDVRGQVAGLNVRRLPNGDAFPATELNASLNIQGRGTDPRTMDARFALAAGSSSISGVPLETGLARLVVQGGVLGVDTLDFALGGARVSASGAWGLTRPLAEPLRLNIDAPDLTVFAPIIGAVSPEAEPRLAGSLAMQGTLAGSLDQPMVDVVARGRNLRFREWRAGALVADVELARVDSAWVGNAEVASDEVVLAGRETLESLRLRLNAQAGRVAVNLSARRNDEANVSLAGVAELDQQQLRGIGLDSLALRIGGSDWRLAAPTRLQWGGVDGIAVDSLLFLRAGDPGGRIFVDGVMPPDGDATLTIAASNVDVADLAQLLPDAPEVGGVLSMGATLTGPVNNPQLFLDLRLASPTFSGVGADTLLLTGRFADGRLETTVSGWVGTRRVAFAEANAPMRLSLADFTPDFELQDEESITARLVADSLPLELLTAGVPQVSEGTGIATGEITLAGTPNSPRLAGGMQLERGAVRIEPLGVRYTGIRGRLSLDGNLLTVDSLVAQNAGSVLVNGSVVFDQLTTPRLQLEGTLSDFRAIDRSEVATVELTGRVALTGQWPDPVLTGQVTLDDGTISIPGIGEQVPLEITDIEVGRIGPDSIPDEAAEPTLAERVRIDGLEATVSDGVWVESLDGEVRVQIRGELLVYRTGEELRVFGNLSAERGTYTLSVGPITREFDVVAGQIEFFGTPDLNPSLDIQAGYQVRTAAGGSGAPLNIIVQLTGSVQSPRVQLTSDTRPPLPESELLSYLIFGRPGFELGGATEGLARELVVQELAGGLLLGPLEQALLNVGLFDYVRIRGRPTTEFGGGNSLGLGSTAVEVGKELFPNVFFTVECGVATLFGDNAATECGTSVAWQINDQWSASAAYEPLRRDRLLQRILGNELQYQFTTELRRRWEYGQPPGDSTMRPDTQPPPNGELETPPAPPPLDPQPAKQEEAPR